jgi:hypothetical protein
MTYESPFLEISKFDMTEGVSNPGGDRPITPDLDGEL